MKSGPKTLKQATDEELMILYQNGHSEAFEVLYQRYAARVYGFFRSKLEDTGLVEDAHQAAFMKLHQARDQYDPSFPFCPWLFTVCRNALFDLLRSRQRLNRREALDPEALENVPAPEAEEAGSSLQELEMLPTGQREVLEMRYLEDLSFDEMAHRLETTPINVRQKVSRAIRNLKDLIRNKGGERS